MPESVAGESPIGVGGIFPERLLQFCQECPQIGPPFVQQRPDQPYTRGKLTARGDAGQAGEAGAAEDAVQHRLGLVVGGVAGGDNGAAVFPGDGRQPGIALLTGGRFEVAAAGTGQGGDVLAG